MPDLVLQDYLKVNPMESLVDLEQLYDPPDDSKFVLIRVYFEQQRAYLEFDLRVFTEFLTSERSASFAKDLSFEKISKFDTIHDFPCLRHVHSIMFQPCFTRCPYYVRKVEFCFNCSPNPQVNSIVNYPGALSERIYRW